MFFVLSCFFFCVSSQFIAYPTAFDGSTYLPPTGTAVNSFGTSKVDNSIASSAISHELSTANSESKTSSLTDVTWKSVPAATTPSIYDTPSNPDSEVSTSLSSTSTFIYESNGLLEPNDVGYSTSTTVIHTYYETVPCTTTSSSSSTTPISVPISHTPLTSTITTSSEQSFASQTNSSSLMGIPNDSQPMIYSTSTISGVSALKTSTKITSKPSFKSDVKYNSSSYCSPPIVISTVTVTGRVVTKTELAMTTVTSIVS